MREWLKDMRISKGLTMAEMGEKLGITVSSYCRIEHGDRQKDMDLDLAAKLSKIFSISIVQIGRLEEKQNE